MKNVWHLKDFLRVGVPAVLVGIGTGLLAYGSYANGHTDGAVYGADIVRAASMNVYDDYDEKMAKYIKENSLEADEDE